MVDSSGNVYGRRGLDGRKHIPELPFWVAIIRIIQFFLSLIVVILVGYASSVFGADSVSGYGHAFFTFAWTVVFLIYVFVTPLWLPQTYNYWTHLVFETTLAIFWLVTWALLAQESSRFDTIINDENQLLTIEGDAGDNIKNYLPPSYNHAIDATKAAAGIGALTWALFVVTLILFGRSVQRHRIANGASGFRFGVSTAPATGIATAPATGIATAPATGIATTMPVDVEAASAPQEKYSSTTHTQPPMEMNPVQHHEPQYQHETQHHVSLPAAA